MESNIIILSEASVRNYNFTPPDNFSISHLPSQYDIGINLNGDPNQGTAILFRPYYRKGSYSQRLQHGLWLPLYIPKLLKLPNTAKNSVDETRVNQNENKVSHDYDELPMYKSWKQQKTLKKDLLHKIRPKNPIRVNKKMKKSGYRHKKQSTSDISSGFSCNHHIRQCFKCPLFLEYSFDCMAGELKCHEQIYSVHRFMLCNNCRYKGYSDYESDSEPESHEFRWWL